MNNTIIGLLITAGLILFGLVSFYFEHVKAKKTDKDNN